MKKDSNHWKDIWIPALSMIVALTGIISGVILNIIESNHRTSLKKYEVTFLEKQRIYSKFMESVYNTFYTPKTKWKFYQGEIVMNFEKQFFSIEPFLSNHSKNLFREKIHEFVDFCSQTKEQPQQSEQQLNESIEKFIKYRDEI